MSKATANKQSFFSWLLGNLRTKVVLLSMFPVYLITLFAYPMLNFNSTDKLPEFSIIDAAKQREFGEFTVKVKTGLYIKTFTIFDVLNNKFAFEALVWFEFNSNEIMLETIGKFGVDNGKINFKSPPDIKVTGDVTLATYTVQMECRADLDYVKFPLEDHKLSIIITNNSVTPYEMFFLVDNTWFNTAPELGISNWKIRDLNTDSGYFSPALDTKNEQKNASYPKAVFNMKLQKSGIKKVMVIFIPIYVVMMLSLFSFLMGMGNTVGRFSLASAGVSAELGYRFVIEKMIPEVSYFTVADNVYLLLLISCFVVFVTQLFFGRYYGVHLERSSIDNDAERAHAAWVLEIWNGIVFYLILASVMGLSAYFIFK